MLEREIYPSEQSLKLIEPFTLPFEKGGLRGIFKKIIYTITPSPLFFKGGTEQLQLIYYVAPFPLNQINQTDAAILLTHHQGLSLDLLA